MARGNETEIVVTSKDKTDFTAPKRKAETFSKDTVDAAKKAGQQIQQETKESLRKVGEEYDKAGKQAADALKDGAKKGGDGVEEELDKSSQQGGKLFLGNIKGFLKHAQGEFRDFGNRAKESVSDIGTKAKSAGGKFAAVGKVLGTALAGGLLAAAAIVGTKLVDAMGIQAANAKLAGQLSLGPEAAAKASQAAADVYKNNWGQSIEDVNDAIFSVNSSLGKVAKLSKGQIESMTTSALTLRDAFGVEVSESANAAGLMIRNGMAKNAKQAFDIITVGFQEGNDRAGDWLDTLNEYGPQFQKLGIDGPHALSLINAAMEAGARNTDIAADFIKEFSIRAVDGSKLTQQGFEAAGLDAKKMADEIGKGGPAAEKAFRQVLTAVTSIKDPVKREAAGVALFGTQWEDLGPKAATAMAAAETGVEELDGATKKLGDTMGNTLQGKFESLKRSGEVWANSKLVPFIDDLTRRFDKDFAPALEQIKQAFSLLVPPMKELGEKVLGTLKKNISGITDAFKDNQPQLELFAQFIANDVAPVVGTILVTSMRAAGLAIEYLIRSIGFLVDAFLWLKENVSGALATGLEAFDIFFRSVVNYIKMTMESFRGYARATDTVFGTNTEKALDDAINSFDTWAAGVNDSTRSAIDDLRGWQNEARSERNLLKLKANKQDIESKIADVKRKLRDPNLTNPQKTKLRADASRLRADLIAAQAAINRLRGKTVTLRTNREIYTYRVTTYSTRRGAQVGQEHGGITGSHAAEGGPRGNETWVGEHGPELVKLPPGSMVHSNPDSMRIAAGEYGKGWNKGGSGEIHLTIVVGGQRLGQLLIRPLRNEVVALGGDVQAVLGKG